MSTPIFRHLLKTLIAFQYVVLLILHHIKALIVAVIYNVFFYLKNNSLRQNNKYGSFNLIAFNLLKSEQTYFLRVFSLKKLG